jgi:hypothetical protein
MIVVFFARRKIDDLVRRVLYTTVMTVLALLGPCLWMLRNHSVDGSLLGPRYPPVFGVLTVAHQYVLAIAKTFLPGPDIFEDLVFVVVVVLLALALHVVYRSRTGGLHGFVSRLRPWAVLLLVSIIYVVYLYAAELSTKIDPIDSRLLVPIYVPCVVLLVGLIDAVLSRSSLTEAFKRYLWWGLAAFLCVQVLISLALVGDFALKGRDFTANTWRTSSVITRSKSLVGVTVYYTNNPSGLWANLGGDNIFGLPDSVAQVRQDLSCPGARIIYFTAPPGAYYGGSNAVSADTTSVKLNILKTQLHARTIFSSSEGDILRPGSGATSSSHCP